MRARRVLFVDGDVCLETGFLAVAETYLPDQWVAALWTDVDANSFDRVKIIKIHYILARLTFDPIHRRFDRNARDDCPELIRFGMKRGHWHDRPEC